MHYSTRFDFMDVGLNVVTGKRNYTACGQKVIDAEATYKRKKVTCPQCKATFNNSEYARRTR